jgi:hypothetical protein
MRGIALVLLLGVLGGVCGFGMQRLARRGLISLQSETTTTLSPRDERRRILGSPNYNRMGFKEEKLGVEEVMSSEFTSPLVAELRANKGTITRGDVTIKLAEFYGFCWGVERAVSLQSLMFWLPPHSFCSHFWLQPRPFF